MGNIVVVPTHIDTDLFRPADKWPDLVAAVGRLSPEKNTVALIQAIAGLPWAHLWIFGEWSLR